MPGARIRSALVGGVVFVGMAVAAPCALAAPLITEFSSGLQAGNSSAVENIAAGPDGNVWFTDQGPQRAIGRITPSGGISEFSNGLLMGSAPSWITSGPDGNLWFTDEGATAIGTITPSGTIDEFTGLQMNSSPSDIVTGPDGNLWFTDRGGTHGIGRITTSGTITEFSIGLQPGNASSPFAIAAGPDGNLWFTDMGTTPEVGRITPTGTINEFSAGLTAKSFLTDIVAGPDGNLWFVDRAGVNGGTNAIGRITPSGAITEFSSGLQTGNDPASIALGADGNLWFTDFGDNGGGTPAIGRITPSGAITEFTGLNAGSAPADIAPGPDGNVWFTDQGTTPAVGRVALQLPPAVTTGAATAITTSGATVAGTVNPLGGAVRAITVQYGPTTSYGSTAAATPGTLPAGGTPVNVSAVLSGQPPESLVHYRVVATNPFGTTAGPDRIFTTLTAKPTVSAHQSHRRWREGNRLARLAKAKRTPPVGTIFSFALNERAVVTFTFTQQLAHHKSRKRGKLSFTTGAGKHKLRFAGRIRHSKKLPLGRYTVRITAKAGGKTSAPATLKFTIVR